MSSSEKARLQAFHERQKLLGACRCAECRRDATAEAAAAAADAPTAFGVADGVEELAAAAVAPYELPADEPVGATVYAPLGTDPMPGVRRVIFVPAAEERLREIVVQPEEVERREWGMPAWLNWGPKLSRAKAGGNYGPDKKTRNAHLTAPPAVRPSRAKRGGGYYDPPTLPVYDLNDDSLQQLARKWKREEEARRRR